MKSFKEFMNSPDEFAAFHRGIKAGAKSINPKTKIDIIRDKFEHPNWEQREAHYFFLGVVVGTLGQLLILYAGTQIPKLL